MTSIATSIFKIRSHCDHIADTSTNPEHLSFRRGQPFYALSSDFQSGLYFVSTQFAVPFARTAVCGLVPIEMFDKVDLLSTDPPMRRKAVKKILIPQNGNTQPLSKITAVKVLSVDGSTLALESFCIKVVRGPQSHIITRTVQEFISFSGILGESFARINAVDYPLTHSRKDDKIASLEIYLNRIACEVMSKLRREDYVKLFKAEEAFFGFKSMDEIEAGLVAVRRDSGLGEEKVVTKKTSAFRWSIFSN